MAAHRCLLVYGCSRTPLIRRPRQTPATHRLDQPQREGNPRLLSRRGSSERGGPARIRAVAGGVIGPSLDPACGRHVPEAGPNGAAGVFQPGAAPVTRHPARALATVAELATDDLVHRQVRIVGIGPLEPGPRRDGRASRDAVRPPPCAAAPPPGWFRLPEGSVVLSSRHHLPGSFTTRSASVFARFSTASTCPRQGYSGSKCVWSRSRSRRSSSFDQNDGGWLM